MVGEQHDDGVVGEPVALEPLEDARDRARRSPRPRRRRARGSAPRRRGVDRRRRQRRLLVAERAVVARVGEAPVVGRGRGVGKVRRREEDGQEERLAAAPIELARSRGRPAASGSECSGSASTAGKEPAPERAWSRRAARWGAPAARAARRSSSCRSRARRRRRSRAACARRSRPRSRSPPRCDSRPARSADGSAGPIAGALLGGGEHVADAVMVRLAPGQQRDERRKGARHGDVRLAEAHAARGQLRAASGKRAPRRARTPDRRAGCRPRGAARSGAARRCAACARARSPLAQRSGPATTQRRQRRPQPRAAAVAACQPARAPASAAIA